MSKHTTDVVVIGTGEKGNSATTVWIPDASSSDRLRISQNQTSYWVRNVYLDLGMTIFNNTDQGGYLTKLIKENAGIERVLEYLESVLFKHVEPDVLKYAVTRAIEESFEEGCREKAREIREAIGA